ncbi:MAG: hypothetical protein ACKOS8_14965 [Gemmataceae bacterium]
MDSPTSRKPMGKTLAILLGVMGLAALVTLWGTLRTIQGRRSRDVPATQLPESSLLARLPAESRQVFASRPGWAEYSALLHSLLPESIAKSLKSPAPSRWVAGWTATPVESTLVAEFPSGFPLPEGWQPAGTLWIRNGQAIPSLQADEAAAWSPGLSVVVQNRLHSEAVVWVAGVGTPWKNGLGHRLWEGFATAPEASRISEWAAAARTWLVWVEPQPDRILIRADLECASPQEAGRLEKELESVVPAGTSLRFLTDGPWFSMQYTWPGKSPGPKLPGR